RDLLVACGARETHAFLNEPRAEAEPARFRLDQQETKPRDFVGLLHQQDRPDVLPVALRAPAAVALGIALADEGGHDLRGQRFERLVPAVLLAVDRAVPAYDPTEVAGPRRPQDTGHLRPALVAQRAFDRAHGADHALLVGDREPAQHGRDLGLRALV